MKTEIVKYLETDRSYRTGVTLVIRFSPKLGLKKQLNVHPESEYLKGCIIEELRELAGLKIAELNVILSKAVVIPSKEEKPALPVESDGTLLKADDEYSSRFPSQGLSIQEDDDLEDPQALPQKKNRKAGLPVKNRSRKK